MGGMGALQTKPQLIQNFGGEQMASGGLSTAPMPMNPERRIGGGAGGVGGMLSGANNNSSNVSANNSNNAGSILKMVDDNFQA